MGKNLNMRDWIETLDKAGELVTLNKPVDPKTEMGALLYKSRDKALYFNNVAGFPGWRALGQAPSNLRQAALAFGVESKLMVREFARRVTKLKKPRIVDDGPVREKRFADDEVDMTTLPSHIAGVRDGGRYITSGLIIVRDPDTGVLNMSFHRMQIKGPRRLGILMVPRHLYLIYQKNEAKNKPTPISVIIGHHPMYYFAAAYTGPADLSELELAGALLEEEVEVVKCETNDLVVPAHAEVCYEGEILPHEREEEGPFSEFQDYYVAGTGMNPVIRVDRLMMRKDAIYKEIQNGSEVEGCIYHKVPMSAAMFERLQDGRRIHGPRQRDDAARYIRCGGAVEAALQRRGEERAALGPLVPVSASQGGYRRGRGRGHLQPGGDTLGDVNARQSADRCARCKRYAYPPHGPDRHRSGPAREPAGLVQGWIEDGHRCDKAAVI